MIASSVLGEYLSDVQRFWDVTRDPLLRDLRGTLATSVDQGLAATLADWYGPQIAEDYLRDLLNRAKVQRQTQRQAESRAKAEQWRREQALHQAEKEAPSQTPRRQRRDAAFNERRMRDALLGAVKANGWTGKGVRELARLAGTPHGTTRHVLKRMEADGQILVQPWRRGEGYGRHGIRVLREHPAWSEHEMAHPLALSETSSQVTA